MRARSIAAVTAAVVALIAPGCGGDADAGGEKAGAGDTKSSASDPYKVAFMYVGPLHDGGWNDAWDTARVKLEKELGGKLKTTAKAEVPEAPQAAQVINSLIQSGNDAIVSTTFGHSKYMIEAAKQHPDVQFIQADTSVPEAPNLTGIDYAEEENWYLAGMAAAASSKADKLGLVAAFPIPPIMRAINGFTLGAQAINPDASTQVVLTNSWFDPGKDQQATQSLISSGAGAIGALNSDPAIGRAAGNKDVPWIGVWVDQREYAPSSYITSSVVDWTPALVKLFNSAIDGSYEGDPHVYLDYTDGIFSLAPFGDMFDARASDGDTAKIDESTKGFKSGERSVFAGPVTDVDGKVRVPEGEDLTVEQLSGMDWAVAGVSGVDSQD